MKALALAVALLATSALAGDTVVCSVSFTNLVAGTTAAPASGSCSWARASMVLMQCDQDVYFSSNTSTAGGTVTVATAAMQRVNFLSGNNFDPYKVYLSLNDQQVSVLGVTGTGTCKFIISPFQRKPNGT